MSPLLREALDYAGLGYAIFPCHTAAKAPATVNGVKDATDDPDKLASFFADDTRNIALSCEGLLVIDLDQAEHPWASREWPSGPVARTPRGGWHRFFRKPAGLRVQNWNGKLAPAVDLKTDGGYVLVAPSHVVDPEKGIDGIYTWIEPLISRQELPEVPDWLRGELEEYQASQASTLSTPSSAGRLYSDDSASVITRARQYLAQTPPAISGQGGHAATLWAARVVVRGFLLSDAAAWQLLLEWNATCSPPWSESELQHKLEEARTKPFEKPDGWLLNMDQDTNSRRAKLTPVNSVVTRRSFPEYRPFPVESLPPLMKRFIQNQAAAADCDPAFVALPALSLVAAAIGNSLEVQAKPGFGEPPILWAVTVGDSGTGKTPGMNACRKIAVDIEAKAIQQFRRETVRYGEHRGRRAQAMREAADGDPTEASSPPPGKPKQEHFLIDDATIERIAEDLQSSPRGMLLVNDELANWFNGFSRYKGKSSGDDSPRWLSLYEAGPLSLRRRTAPAKAPREMFVKRATIGLFGGIQPAILAECFRNQKFIASGLAARLLFAYPPKRCPRFTDLSADPLIVSEFETVVIQLRELSCSDDSDPAPILLDAEACQVFTQFHNDGAEEAEGLDGGPMSAVIPKINRIVLRLALVLKAFEIVTSGDDPLTTVIDVDTMERACKLAAWFKQEAERVYAMLAEKPEDHEQRQLVDLIRRKNGRVRGRDLQRYNSRKYPNALSAELALEALVSDGLGSWSDEIASNGKQVRWLVLTRCPTSSDTTEQEGLESAPLSDAVSDPASET